jgi:hypothetical protein
LSKLIDSVATTGGIAGIVAVIIVAFCILPFFFLWAVNSLAELGGSDFYIAHGIWNYFVSVVFLGCVRGS